jgi:hypothetical protein
MTHADANAVRSAHRIVEVNISDLVSLLDMSGEFRMKDVPGGRNQKLPVYVNAGLLRVVRRERENGTSWDVYKWTDSGRARVKAYYDKMSTLPCGCKRHIPSGRDDAPEGMMTCKFCGANHPRRVYREAF